MNQETNQEEIWNKLYNSKIEHLRSIYLKSDAEKRMVLLNNLETLISAPFSKRSPTKIVNTKTKEPKEKSMDDLQNDELDSKVKKFLDNLDFKKMKKILKTSGGIRKLERDTNLYISDFKFLTPRYMIAPYGAQIAHWFIDHGYDV